MVKKCFVGGFFALLAFCFSLPLCASSPQLVTASQIMITNHGIMVNINGQGQILQTSAVVHVGNGVYEINAEYYGSCRRCGWALDQGGKCTNQNCNQYGPRERD